MFKPVLGTLLKRCASTGFHCCATSTTALVEAVSAAGAEGHRAVAAAAERVRAQAHSLSDAELVEVLRELRKAKAPRSFWIATAAEIASRVPMANVSHAAQWARSFALGLGQSNVWEPSLDEQRLWGSIATRLISGTTEVTLDDLSRATDAFALARVRDYRLFEAMGVALERAPTSERTPAVVAQLGSTYASAASWLPAEHCQSVCRALGEAMASHVAGTEQMTEEYTPRRLTSIAAALAAMQEGHGAVSAATAEALEAIIRVRGDRVAKLSGRGFAICCRCMAFCGRHRGKVQQDLFERAASSAQRDQIRAADLALLLNALARGEESPHDGVAPSWSQRLMDHVTTSFASAMSRAVRGQTAQSVTPRDVANFVDALARLRFHDEGLLSALAEYVPDKIESFGQRDVVGVAVAYGRLQERDEAVFITLASRLCEDIQQYSFRELVDIITAFARVRVREPVFQSTMLEHCGTPAAWHALSPGDAVSLLSAWGRLQSFSHGAYDAMSDRVITGFVSGRDCIQGNDDVSFSHLRQVALAFARVGWSEERVLGAISTTFREMKDVPEEFWPAAEKAATILCALARLQRPDQVVSSSVLRHMLQRDQGSESGAAEETRPISLSHWAEALHAAWILDAMHHSREEWSLWRQCCGHVAVRLHEAAALAPLSSDGFDLLRTRWYLLEDVRLPSWSSIQGASLGSSRSTGPPVGLSTKVSRTYARSLLLVSLCNALAYPAINPESQLSLALVQGVEALLGHPPHLPDLPEEVTLHMLNLWHGSPAFRPWLQWHRVAPAVQKAFCSAEAERMQALAVETVHAEEDSTVLGDLRATLTGIAGAGWEVHGAKPATLVQDVMWLVPEAELGTTLLLSPDAATWETLAKL